MFHCQTLVWLHIIPYVSLAQLWELSVVQGFLLLLTLVALHHLRCFTANNLGCFLLSQVFYCCFIGSLCIFSDAYCHSLKWLCVFLGVISSFTWVTKHVISCHTAIYLGGFVSFQVFHCHLHWWLHVIPCFAFPLKMLLCVLGVTLMFLWVAIFQFRCSVLSHCAVSALSNVSHKS